MIARLRRRHGRMVGWVGALALLGLVAAVTARPSWPVASAVESPDAESPDTMSPDTMSPDTTSWSFIGAEGRLRALRERRAAREWISLERPTGLSSPELLVYWAPREGEAATLPAGAVLLGPLGDPGVRRFELPTAETAGSLIIYSLGHDQVLLTEPLISIRLVDHGS